MFLLKFSSRKNNLFILSIMAGLWSVIFSAQAANITTNIVKSEEDSLVIYSDKLTINKTKNTAHFQGSVVIQFEDLIIYTSELDIIYKTNNSNLKENSNTDVASKVQFAQNTKIDKIIIPNILKAIKVKNDEVLIADSGEYICDEGKLILIGDIKFMHQDSVLKTKKLVYYTALAKPNVRED